MVADFGHELREDALVDTWEAFRVDQVFRGQFGKALIQACFILDLTGDAVQIAVILTVQPFGNKVIAIALVWYGD
jgi:hypothetical protein